MPGTTDVRIGGSKRFECQVVGFPRPIIRWYKDGSDITKNKRFKFDFSEEGVISMIIENITYRDEGCYRCKAENSEGLASTAAYLYVLSPSFLNDEDDTTSVHSMDIVDADFTEYELRKQAEVQKQTIERLLTEEIKFHEEALGFSLEEFNAEDALAERLTFGSSAINEEIYVEKVVEESKPPEPPAFTYESGAGLQEEYEIEEEDNKPGISVEVEVQELANQGEKEEENTVEPEPETVGKKLLLAGVEEAAVVPEEVIPEPEPEPTKVEEKVEEPAPLPPGAHVHADGTVCSHGVWRFKHLEVAGKKKRAYATDIVHDDTNLSKEATTIPVPAEKKETKMDGKSAKLIETSKEVESVYGRKSKYSMKEESFMSREETSIIQTGSISDESAQISQTITEAVSSQSVSVIGGQQVIDGGQSMIIQVSDSSVSGSIVEQTGGSTMKIFSSDVDTETSVMTAFIDTSELMLRAEVGRVSMSPESSASVESVTIEEEFKTFLDKTSKRPMGIESGILTRQISNVQEVVEMSEESIVVKKSRGVKEDSTLNQVSVFGKSETKTELMESKTLTVAGEIQVERTAQATEVIAETREGRTQETKTEMKTEEISKQIDDVALDFDKDKKIDIKVKEKLEAEVELHSAFVTETEETETLIADDESVINNTEEDMTVHREAVDEGLTTSEDEATADEGLDISLDEVQVPEEMKPVIVSVPKDVTVTEGSKVCLEFEVTGYPAPTCTWYQDRRLVTDSAERITTQTRSRSILEIFEATVKSSGTYTFTMENALGRASTDVRVAVTAKPRPPVITSKLQDISITKGDKLTMEFTVSGSPAPDVKWFINSSEIKEKRAVVKNIGEKYTLTIKEASVSDSGSYSLKATNEAGEASADVMVTVSEPKVTPKISKGPKSVTTKEGETISIEFQLSGNPTPVIEWQKDGVKLLTDARISSRLEEDRVVLDIKDSTPTDSGKYTVIAENDAGQTSQSVNVTVFIPDTPLTITPMGPTTVDVKAGETIRAEFMIIGSPAPDVKWFINNSEIKEKRAVVKNIGEKYTLTIKEAIVSDSGSYSLKATNEAGEASADVMVTVSEPKVTPKISKGPKSVTTKQGEIISIEFQLSGNPTPVIEWQKDGVKLLTDARISSRLEEDRVVLDIKDSTPADSGKYTVIAENNAGQTSQSVNVTVSILDTPPTITPMGPTTIDVKAGETIQAGFLITGNPTPVIEWHKDGVKLLTDARVSSRLDEDRVVLDIKDSTPDDSGKYTVIAENDAGKTSQSVTVTVSIPDSPPTITPKGPTTVDVKAGETIRAEFLITGSPVPTVEWQKDSVHLKTNKRVLTTIQEESAILEINDSMPSDSGRYSMITTNMSGSLTQIIDIVVAAPQTTPTITEGAKQVNVKEGETIHVEFKVTGSPMPDGQWSKDGTILQLSNRVKASEKEEAFCLDIAESVPADSGTYTLMANNPAGRTSHDVSITVTMADVPPSISKCSPPVDGHEGQDVHVEVTVSGTPAPDVQWFKNEIALKASKRVSLTQKDTVYALDIPKSLSSDSGTYTVTARNHAGEVSHDVSVMVTIPEVPPSIMKSSSSISISEGQDVHVEVTVAGTPAPEVKWSKDGSPIRTADRISISQHGDAYVLDIPSAETSDSGTYTLTAVNPAGTVSQDISVTVTIRDVPPSIVKASSSVNITEGQDIQLEVAVNGTPAPEVVWLRDGASIKKSKRISTSQVGETHILSLPKAVAADSAIYTLAAKNPAGESSHDVSVTVTIPDVPPSITKSSPAIKVTEGEVVHIEATIAGKPEPDVQWTKDGSKVKESDRVSMSCKDETVVLEIPEGLSFDSGTYTLTVTNRAGEVAQDVNVTVSLRDVPPGVVMASPSVTATEGQDVHLDVTITGTPVPEITWLKDGKDIKKMDRVSTSQSDNTFTLDILKSQQSDSGTYHVTAKNPAGETSHDISVTVTLADVPPSIMKSSPNIDVTEGQDVHIEVTVAGTPAPEISWLKDGVALKKSDRVAASQKNETFVLEIPKSLSSDSGTYTLTAKNAEGEVSSDVYVMVTIPDVPPSIVKSSPAISIIEGQDVHVEVTVQGRPAPEGKWSKDDSVIKQAGRVATSEKGDTFVLDIPKAVSSDSGTYTLTVKNSAGQMSQDVSVTVSIAQIAPSITGTPSPICVMEGETIHAEFTVKGTPAPEILWSKDGVVLKKSDRATTSQKNETFVLEIPKSLSSDSGTYTLTAKNPAGEVSSDVTIMVAIPDVPPSIVKSSPAISIIEGQDVHIEVTVQGKPAPEGKWSKDGSSIKKAGRVATSEKGDTFVLDIPKAVSSDSGTYTLMVKNSAGQLSQDVCVTVSIAQTAPSITGTPSSISVTEGETIHAEFTVKGTPAPEISWSKDGVVLKKSDRVAASQKNETFVLEIPKSLSSDSGTYTLTAKNPAGEVSSDVYVTVTIPDVPPSIVKSSPAISIIEGQDVHVEVTVQGKPAPEGKWTKDGSSIKKVGRVATSEKGDIFVLDIPKALSSDTGTYTLTVKNSAGQTSQDVNVTITIPQIAPSITKTPSPISVTEGETINAVFTVKGDPEPEAKWTKDGSDLKKSTRIAVTQKKDVHILEISKATTADCGTYKLNVKNPAGETSADVHIEVTIPQPPTESPSIVDAPGEVNVTEGQELHLEVTVKARPSPDFRWLKDGKALRLSERISLKDDGNKATFTVKKAAESDSGTYTLVAQNPAGKVTSDINVSVTLPMATKQDDSVTTDATPESIVPDSLYLKEYVVLVKHKDKDTSVTLPKGDIVEILDSKNPESWLVRRKDRKDQVCFVPASNVKPVGEEEADSDAAGGRKKKERKLPPAPSQKMSSGEKEGEEDDHQRLRKVPTEHVVVADRSPPGDDPDNLKLVEGDSVDALDTANPEHWLVCVKATKTDPERQGWVPACYLDPKASPGAAARTSREAFREEVLQITNKQQEATVKRSSIDESGSTQTPSEAPAAYAVTELLETEREYIRDVQLLRDHYIQNADDSAIVKDNKDVIFGNLDAILSFHNDTFLSELTACTVNPGSIGKLFLNFKDKFDQYVPFGVGRPASNVSLSIPEVKAFFEEVGKKHGDADSVLQEYLQKPLDRIHQYLMVLKDILRYTSRAGEPCQDVEQSIHMLMGIQQRIHDLGWLAQLKGYHGDVTSLGQLIRHADLSYWDGPVEDSEGKERHLFLFPDRILVTKEEKPASSTEGPAFIYQSEIELPKIQLNDSIPEEDLRFELWCAEPEEQPYLSLQGRSAQTKKVWLKDLREALKKIGVQETDIMPERRSLKAASPEVPTPPSPKEAELEIVTAEEVAPAEEEAPKTEEAEPTPGPEIAPKPEEAKVVEPEPATQEPELPKEEVKPEPKEEPKPVEKEPSPPKEEPAPVEKESTPPKEEPKTEVKEPSPPKEEPILVVKEPSPPKAEPKPIVKEPTPPKEEPKPVVKEPTPPKEEPKPEPPKPEPPKEEPKPVVTEPTPPKEEPKPVVKEPTPPKPEPPKEESKPAAREPTPPKEEPKPEPEVTLAAPMCPEKMDNCQVEEGRLARFDCRVVAYPEPEITWVRDGKIVKPGGRFQLMNPDDVTYALLIKDAQISDSGLYKCWARNKYGEASTEGELIVSALSDADQGREHTVPMFLSPLQKVEAREGRTVELRCSIAGFPQPNITWQVDGREIKQAKEFQMHFHNDDCILAIKEAYPEDSGIYTCRLVNPMGEVSCSAQVLIKPDLTKKDKEAPPKFIRKFYDTETKKGNDFEFECAVHGDPAPTVTWQYKGKPIQESRRCKMKADGSKCSLKIRDAEWDDEGDYTCTAKNSQGSISCKAYLTVTEAKPPPKPAQPAAKVQKEEGFAPTFTKRLRDVDAAEGRKAKFECRVMGQPEPNASWEKDGKPYSKNPRAEMGLVDGDKHYLIINDATKEDSGEYTITLTNKLGKATTSGVLYVGEPRTKSFAPRFTPPPGEETELMPPTTRPYRSLFAKGGIPTLPYDKPTLLDVRRDSTRLSWLPVLIPLLPEDEKPCTYIVECKEASSSFWTKIATDLQGNSHLATNLNPDDEYFFRVRAENKMGISEPTTPVLLVKRSVPERKAVTVEDYLGPMDIPEHKPFVSEYGTESMRLSWKPPKMPAAAKDLAPLSYRLEQQQLPGTDWMPLGGRILDNSYYIHDLNPDQDYRFRVRSENRYGVSRPTSALSLQRASTYPDSPIARPTIMELDTDSVMLSWRRVDVPMHQIDDEPLTYLIEMQSPPQPDWRELARRIPTTTYKVKGLKMDQDYNFRIRAQTMRGLSAPSPPISLYRTLANVRSPVSDINVDYDLDSIRLNWTSVNIPPYHLDEEPLLYVLEMQDNRLTDWRPLASGIPTTSYRFSGPSPPPDTRVRVRAMTEYGLSPPTAPVQLSREGRRPLEDLKVIRTEPEAVHLSWRPILIPDSDEPIKYAVEFQEHPQTDWRVMTRGVVGTNYRAAGLSPTKDYSFRVRADTITRLHEPSAPVSVYKSPVPPRLPLHEPVISDIGASSVRLSWKPADFPVYLRDQIPLTYTVEMQEPPENTWRPIKHGLLQTNYLVPDIQSHKDYKFRVRATSDYGSSDPSLPVLLYRKPVPTLPIHEPLISEIKGESARLSWQPASLPDHLSGRDTPFTYRIEVQEPPSNNWMPLCKNVRTCDYHLTKLRPDKDYVYRIRAESEFGMSEPSLPVYIARRAVPPRIPRDQPYVTDMKPDSVMLSWRAVELPLHILDYSPITYLLEVQDAPGSHWMPLARRIPQTSYRVTNLKPNQDYTFRVRAENDYGVSEPTLPLLLKRRAVVPVMPKEEPLISDVRPGSIRLSWRPANLPTYLRDSMPILYSIYIQDTPLNTWTPIVKRVAHSSHYITNLQHDKDYYFRVQAENEYGSSEPTLPVRLSREPSPRVPIDTPEIVGFEPSALKLSWKRRPHFETHAKPLSYQVEVEEPHSRDWRKVAGGIRDTSYTVSGLEPRHDYRFRVRGETDIGLTEPSVPVTFDRSRLHPSVPIERPDLFDIQPTSARLSWRRIYIPPYDRPDIQLRYLVEYKELGNTQWRSLVSRIPDTSYHVTGLDAKKDYMFRVRADTDELGLSDPTPYVPLYRKSVIPRVPVSIPSISDVGHDYVGLRWNKVHVPAFGMEDEPLKFMVEQRELSTSDWSPVARGITDTSYRVGGLKSNLDYQFRVRGESPYAVTEPASAVSLFRKSGYAVASSRMSSFPWKGP